MNKDKLIAIASTYFRAAFAAVTAPHKKTDANQNQHTTHVD